MKAPGAKHDSGKPALFSVLRYFPRALTEVAKVNEHGAALHGWDTWQTIDNPQERYANAQLRHELAECLGEARDPDSGLLHAAHKAWNSLARLELLLQQKEQPAAPRKDYVRDVLRYSPPASVHERTASAQELHDALGAKPLSENDAHRERLLASLDRTKPDHLEDETQEGFFKIWGSR